LKRVSFLTCRGAKAQVLLTPTRRIVFRIQIQGIFSLAAPRPRSPSLKSRRFRPSPFAAVPPGCRPKPERRPNGGAGTGTASGGSPFGVQKSSWLVGHLLRIRNRGRTFWQLCRALLRPDRKSKCWRRRSDPEDRA